MATTFNSNQYALQTVVRRSGEPGQTTTLFFDGVTPTADTGTINLIILPPGKLRVFPTLSGFICANMAATANVAIGLSAYTDANTTVVAANTTTLKTTALANAYVAANAPLSAPANLGLDLNTLTGVTVIATVTTANTVANASYSGFITVSRY